MYFFFRTAIVALSLLTGCTVPPVKLDHIRSGDYESVRKYLTWMIETQMKELDVKGLSIALVDDQQVVWSQGFGFADVENKIRATPETVYRVASISKLFTATAAMQLAEQGKIDIAQPLSTYLPEFSMKTRFQDSDPITPRTLMTHHSGLPSDRIKGRFNPDPVPFTQLVHEIKDEYVSYPPNHIFSYSSLAFGLLGHLIERVEEKEFSTHMEEVLLGPVGMRHSSFVLRPEIRRLLAKGYMNKRAVGVEDWPIRNLPASSLYSNVLDLGRFMQMVFAEGRSGDRQILRPETLTEMFHPQNADVLLDFDFQIGLGWFLGDTGIPEAGGSAGHGGDLMAFYSQLKILPRHKLGVVVLSNTDRSNRIVSFVADTALGLMLKAKTGLVPSPPVKTLASYPVRLTDKILRSYQGSYATNAGFLSIRVESGSLQVNTDRNTLYLVPRSDGWFIPKYQVFGPFSKTVQDTLVSFPVVSGREVVVIRHGRQNLLFGERIRPEPLPESWRKRLGKYQVINQDDHLKIVSAQLNIKNEILVLEAYGEVSAEAGAGRKEVIPLSPLSDTEAVIWGPGFGMGETVFIVKREGEERLRYSGYEAKKILDP